MDQSIIDLVILGRTYQRITYVDGEIRRERVPIEEVEREPKQEVADGDEEG